MPRIDFPHYEDHPGDERTVEWVNDSAGLTEHVGAWRRLAEVTLDDNPFYEPSVLLPALESYREPGISVGFVYAPLRKWPAGNRVLCGVFPLKVTRSFRGLPVRTAELWRFIHCYLTTPLIRPEETDRTLDALFTSLVQPPHHGTLLHFPLTSAEGEFHRTFQDYLYRREQPFFVMDVVPRAMFERRATADSFMARWPRKKRHDLKRLEKKLAGHGRLVCRRMAADDDVNSWIDRFLALEADGWKGRDGSALACQDRDARFLRRMARGLAAEGRLMVLALELNQQPIAMKLNLLNRRGGFSFKIAYDEAWSRFSPGALLEMENIVQLHNGQTTDWMDSCAAPDHPMINTLWPDRRLLESLVVATGRRGGGLAVSTIPLARWVKQQLVMVMESVRRVVHGRLSAPARRARLEEGMTMAATLTTPQQDQLEPFAALDPQVFHQRFNRQPFKIQHRLGQHPLFELDRLIELSRILPAEQVEYNAGNLPISQDPSKTPRNGLSIEETIRRIQQCQSWMVLKNVEQDPEYRELLDQCLNQIARYTEPLAPGMFRREGFIFISSAGSVTPFHIDPENNFLLQIRGVKRVQMFDVMDRTVLSENDLETFFTGAHRNLSYKDAFEPRGEWFELTPGEGLHFPVAAPHWVKNGPEVSISFSITFQTSQSEMQQSLYRLNRKLRTWGLSPAPIGVNRFRDGSKVALLKAFRLAKQLLGVNGQPDGPQRTCTGHDADHDTCETTKCGTM